MHRDPVSRSIRSLARHVGLFVLALPLLGSPASALDACLENVDGSPLSRVWVTHWFHEAMTDASGCFSMPGLSGAVDVTVHAHNPVVKMENGLGITEDVRVRHGGTFRLRNQEQSFARAEEFRLAYQDGLQSFSLWHDEFATGVAERTAPEVIRAVEEGLIAAHRSFVEPKAVGTDHPLIHLRPDIINNQPIPHGTVTHELGHALHFSQLSPAKRERIQNDYLYWLAIDPEKTHCFEKRTMPMLAYLEAFGFFAQDWEETAAAAGIWRGTRLESSLRRNAFFAKARSSSRGPRLANPVNGFNACSFQEPGPMHGDDVEGAVYMTLFHDFAQAQGLEFVVEQYVSCQSLDVQEFGHCIKQRHSSAVFRSLVSAGANWGIRFDADSQRVADSAQAGEHFGHATASGDFDGDGHLDLAIGVPDELVGSVRAGAVNVIYGTADGLRSERNQFWHMNVTGVHGSNHAGDRFGHAVATGDFDADGYDDLAIGVPSDRLGTKDDAGQVIVLFGSKSGLGTAGAWGIHQDTPGIQGVVESGDQFGFALEVGDFDLDGHDDLAVGVPYEDVGSLGDAGGVAIVYGTKNGFGSRDQWFSQNTRGVLGVSEAFDNMGFALAVGDFDGDKRDDLAIGVPNEDHSLFEVDSGVVNVLYGAIGGLTATGDQLWHQNSSGIADGVEAFDNFGQALAAGDFDADGRDDLAIGVPNEDLGLVFDAGIVHVVYGTTVGLRGTNSQRFHQNILEDVAETFDNFGASLAAGDFDRNGRDDLAIGVPKEDLDLILDAGAVAVVFATDTGRLSTAGNRFLNQLLPGFEADPFPFDDFGRSLTSADLDGDGFADLAIGTPGDDVDAVGGAGSVEVLVGTEGGLFAGNRTERWHQNR